jgi:hypothetical protein
MALGLFDSNPDGHTPYVRRNNQFSSAINTDSSFAYFPRFKIGLLPDCSQTLSGAKWYVARQRQASRKSPGAFCAHSART